MARVFISYKRGVEPDEPFALRLHAALSPQHAPFIDQQMLVGTQWVDRIRQEIEQADFLIVLISRHSIQSGMVAQELKIATNPALGAQAPRILPVRLAYADALPFDIAGIVERLQYVAWHDEADSPRVVDDLLVAVGGGEARLLPPDPRPRSPPPDDLPLPCANPSATIRLEQPGGTMPPDSPFYVRRDCDVVMGRLLELDRFAVTVRGARQMGKSSLLERLGVMAKHRGHAVAHVNLQGLGDLRSMTPLDLYQAFVLAIEQELDRDSRIAEQWSTIGTAIVAATEYFGKRILGALGEQRLLLSIDEADLVMTRPDSQAFYGMLRSWWNRTQPRWRRLNMALSISTEPTELITDLQQSPFNIGEEQRLQDFSEPEFAWLIDRHGLRMDASDRSRLYTLLHGHCFLSRRALYLLCQGTYSLQTLHARAEDESGPFGDHLRAILTKLGRYPELQTALRDVYRHGTCQLPRDRHRLQAAGLAAERDGRLQPRNELYRRFFERVTFGH